MRGLLDEQAPPFTALLSELVDLVLWRSPAQPESYEAAQRHARALMHEHSSQPPRQSNAPARPPGWLIKPTAFRAQACVLYIASHPDASNKQVARAVGISHQG